MNCLSAAPLHHHSLCETSLPGLFCVSISTDSDLPATTGEVKSRDEGGLSQPVDEVVHSQHWIMPACDTVLKHQ